MNSVRDALSTYINDDTSLFTEYHYRHPYAEELGKDRIDNATKSLNDFLFATMDEVRFKHANDFAKYALDMIDMGELDYLRKGLLRREEGREISYLKHRDHSAHTVYNYILGWYLYENNPTLKKCILEHFKMREKAVKDVDLEYYFAYLWPFLSIVHDIGYLFEGTLEPLSSFMQSDQIKMGIEVVIDFFTHHLWVAYGFNSVFEREHLLELSNVMKIPEIKGRSMGELVATLRYLDNLDEFRKYLIKDHNSKGCPISDVIPGDSFSLWENHYKSIGINSMAERIRWIEKVFYHFLDEGLSSNGFRMIDHGVCSGLLLLLNSTFYYKLFYNLYYLTDLNDYDNYLKTKFIATETLLTYDIYWWWSAIIWGTAATAIHNIQQIDNKDLGELAKERKILDINEDPLAYLGILVDCLQEWDRSTTFRESMFSESLPLQGKDVELKIDSGKIVINYNNNEYSEKISKTLNSSLMDWDKIISIAQ